MLFATCSQFHHLPRIMLVASTKRFITLLFASQTILAASVPAAPVKLVSRPSCGNNGAVAFSSKPELAAAVTCYTTFTGCNSTDLPETARTSVQDLGVLGELMDLGFLDGSLKGGTIDKDVVIKNILAVRDDPQRYSMQQSLVDNLIRNLERVLKSVLKLVSDLLRDLTREFGTSMSDWCVESVDNLDYLFAGLSVSEIIHLEAHGELASHGRATSFTGL